MKKAPVAAIFLGIAGGLFLTLLPSINSPTTLAAPPPQKGLDVAQLQRDASRRELPSFDDEYQRYVGVLDVLGPYPEPLGARRTFAVLPK